MDSGNNGKNSGKYDKGDDITQTVYAGSVFACSQLPNKIIINRDLTEHTNHKTKSHYIYHYIHLIRHDSEKEHLNQSD